VKLTAVLDSLPCVDVFVVAARRGAELVALLINNNKNDNNRKMRSVRCNNDGDKKTNEVTVNELVLSVPGTLFMLHLKMTSLLRLCKLLMIDD
jgi:hypothetical protein